MRYLVEVIEQSPEAVEVQNQSPAKHRTVDVVAAGADPTGAADSTAAINQAIRRVHELACSPVACFVGDPAPWSGRHEPEYWRHPPEH